MNDIALSGLAKQLVQAELLTETSARQSWAQAQRNRVSLVNYLVHNKLVNSRQIAGAKNIIREIFGVSTGDNTAAAAALPQMRSTRLSIWRRVSSPV